MRTAVRILAGSTVAGTIVLLSLAAPVVYAPRAENPQAAAGDRLSGPPPGAAWIDGVRPRLESMRLPTRGPDLDALLRTVDRASARFSLDPVAVLAVILVESRFDSDAVSPQGAMGLMQLQAETARELAEDLGIPWTSDQLLHDPETNVLLGTYYLSRLVHRFGDLDLALAAFNAGPGRVQAVAGAAPCGYANRVWDAVIRLRLRPLA